MLLVVRIIRFGSKTWQPGFSDKKHGIAGCSPHINRQLYQHGFLIGFILSFRPMWFKSHILGAQKPVASYSEMDPSPHNEHVHNSEGNPHGFAWISEDGTSKINGWSSCSYKTSHKFGDIWYNQFSNTPKYDILAEIDPINPHHLQQISHQFWYIPYIL
jgi:hypothetical protein